MERTFGLLGAGNLGTSISAALKIKDSVFSGVCDIDMKAAKRAARLLDCPTCDARTLAGASQVLLFAVPDKKIAPLYEEIKPDIVKNTILVHFSGTLASDLFTSHPGLSAHPAHTFPHPRTEEGTFKGVYFALEGAAQAVDFFMPRLEDIGARIFMIEPKHKPLYHAACVMVSNLVLGLAESAAELYESIGIDKKTAEEIAIRFVKETSTDAVGQHSLSAALSGPLVRGDAETVQSNIRALDAFPEAQELYKLLSRKILALAREKGLGDMEASTILKLLSR